MRRLPPGPVTLLFTDIDGSTRLLHELGEEAYSEALVQHRRVLREAFGANGGVEVDTQGDAFFVAFSSATGAVAAAVEAQAALTAGPVLVRMGLHTGTPMVTAEGYVGEDVHLGARVAASGHGGQVLLSKATRELVVRPDVRDLGEHRLKDFDQPVWIYQLGDALFPPLKTISNTNLPRPASSFVGRGREVEEVVSLLRGGTRLLTLTGPGGSGKTRLAIEAAAEMVGEFRNGTVWVGLATVRDPELVLATVTQAVGAQEELPLHIGEKEMLLLLDNLEQVVEAAPELAALVEACPHLKVIVTSRELLRVRGEVEFGVLPLAGPDAVELFCLRSGLTAGPAIEELCRRLDQMPLALELAAARTKILSPEQILERLAERLDLFKGGRDADPRQATLRATIEWSYALLTLEEQRLFARLAVFAGGCTLDSAREVSDADFDTLQSLVEKSLLRYTNERFWMLETIRELAVERLVESGEDAELRRKHAEHYLDIAESANLSLDAVGRVPRHKLVLIEQDNLRAAMDWAGDADVELGLRLAVALENFWATHDPREGARRLQPLLERAVGVDVGLLIRAWRDYGGCHDVAGDVETARAAYERSGELSRQAGDERGVASSVFRLGVAAWVAGDLEQARRLHEESLEMFRRIGDPIGELQALGNLGWFNVEHGDPDRGLEMVDKSLAMAREAGWIWWEALQLGGLAEAALQADRFEEGERLARQVLASGKDLEDRKQVVYALAMLAWAAAGSGDGERAALLWAAVQAEEPGPGRFWALDREQYAERLSHLPRPGSVLHLDKAVEYALSVDSRT